GVGAAAVDAGVGSFSSVGDGLTQAAHALEAGAAERLFFLARVEPVVGHVDEVAGGERQTAHHETSHHATTAPTPSTTPAPPQMIAAVPNVLPRFASAVASSYVCSAWPLSFAPTSCASSPASTPSAMPAASEAAAP